MNDDDPGTSGYAYRQAATAYQHALETFGSMGSGAYWGEGDRWYALGVERQAAEAGEVPAEFADENQVRCSVAAEAWRRGNAATSPEIASAWRDASTLIDAADQAWKTANEATEKAQDAWNRAEAEAGEVPAESADAWRAANAAAAGAGLEHTSPTTAVDAAAASIASATADAWRAAGTAWRTAANYDISPSQVVAATTAAADAAWCAAAAWRAAIDTELDQAAEPEHTGPAADATAAKPSGKPGSLNRNYTYSGFTLTPDGMRHQPCQELITDLYTALNVIEAVEYHQCPEEAAEAEVTE